MLKKTLQKKGIINLGYPCICRCLKSGKVTSKITQKKLLSFKKAEEAYSLLLEKSLNNLTGLSNTLDWTYLKNIKFYRIYSDLFPHISNKNLKGKIGEKNCQGYRNLDPFENEIKKLGIKIFKYGIRVTFHPNEYVCLGSPNKEVVESGIWDLHWHGRMVELFIKGAKEKNEEESEKVEEHFRNSVFVLHGGGQYGDKVKTLDRWGEVYASLDPIIKDHLVIENDERNFNPMDLLKISEKHKIPIVVDFFHQDCYEEMHPKEKKCNYEDILPKILKIWDERKMKPKFHVSLQQPGRRLGTHSHYCDTLPKQLKDLQDNGRDFDVMLECKAKEVALFRCYENNKDRVNMEDSLTREEKLEIVKEINEGNLPDFSEYSKEEVLNQIIGDSGTISAKDRSKKLNKERSKKKVKKEEKMEIECCSLEEVPKGRRKRIRVK